MVELGEQRKLEKIENESEESNKAQKKFTAKGVGSAFAKISEGVLEIKAMEANVECFTKFEQNIKEAPRCYLEIYNEKKKQTKQKSILRFFHQKFSYLCHVSLTLIYSNTWTVS